jgi:Cu/Ag efflux protein CusF
LNRFVGLVCWVLIVLAASRPVRAERYVAVRPFEKGTVAKLSPIARIHGRIVSIDRIRGTFMIHHDPFAAMPMAMTMEVAPAHRSDLGKLKIGEFVDVTIDTRVVPWTGTEIRPASSHAVPVQRPLSDASTPSATSG